MAKHKAKLSPKLEEELRDDLERLLDERDDVDGKRKRVAKAIRLQLDTLDGSIILIRRQLKGQSLDQAVIPGTELPDPKRDPKVIEILRLAGGLIEPPKKPRARKPDDDEEPPIGDGPKRRPPRAPPDGPAAEPGGAA